GRRSSTGSTPATTASIPPCASRAPPAGARSWRTGDRESTRPHSTTTEISPLAPTRRSPDLGQAILDWIDACDNGLYSALCFQGAAGWRAQLADEVTDHAARALIDAMDDETLAATMTDLGGHCLESLLEA